MSTHKYIERICAVATLVIIILSILFMNAEKFGIQPAAGCVELLADHAVFLPCGLYGLILP